MKSKYNISQIPDYALDILNTLSGAGFEAFLVGGCVRDALRGVEPHDYDITTNALPEEILTVFDGRSFVTSGIKHGTVGIICDLCVVEVTTYRIEGGYADTRHPDSVSFTRSLREDLLRRDFTINALAFSPTLGVIDCFNGIADLENGIIRCVGNAGERFREDALRMLRAVRFRSQLGFKLEAATASALIDQKDLLLHISSERIASELNGIVMGDWAADALLEYKELIAVFIPEAIPCFGFEQHSKYHKYDVWEHISIAVGAAAKIPEVRIAALLHDIEKPRCYVLDDNGCGHFPNHAAASAATANVILNRLRYPHSFCTDVVRIIEAHSGYSTTEKSVRRVLSALGERRTILLFDLKKADNSAKTTQCLSRLVDIDNAISYINKLIDEKSCVSLKSLEVNGNDMLALGLSGCEIGKTLAELLSLVVDGELENSHESLMNAARLRLK